MLGAVLVAVSAPGLEAPLASVVTGILLAAILAVAGRRSGAALARPGEWFTRRPLAEALRRDAHARRPCTHRRPLGLLAETKAASVPLCGTFGHFVS